MGAAGAGAGTTGATTPACAGAGASKLLARGLAAKEVQAKELGVTSVRAAQVAPAPPNRWMNAKQQAADMKVEDVDDDDRDVG